MSTWLQQPAQFTHTPATPDGDAELAVLAATFIAPAVIDRLIIDHDLQPDDFNHPHHRHIWAAILSVHGRGDRVDPIVLAAELPDIPRGFIDQLPAHAGELGNISAHAQLVKRAALRRRWRTAASRLIEAADTDDEGMVAQAEQLLATPTATDDTWDTRKLGEDACDFLSDTRSVGISTGIPRLDDLLAGGLRAGDMTAIGAWTSMGKSALVDTILHDASLAGYRCHAYLNEMSPRDRTLRTLARISGVKYGHLVRRELDQHTAPRVLQAAQRIPFGLTDCSQWSADQIARHVRANRWELWTLDLVHNIPYERESELHRIVATLAAAARSTGSHLLLICQFNEARAVGELLPMPVARDIRGSGMIKNLAANVLLLHRPQQNHDGFVTTDLEGIVRVDKSRHGRLGAADVVFEPDRMRFVAPGALRVVA